MKYSLWKIQHESAERVSLNKVKDTNSTKEVDRWMDASMWNAASHYREEDELNADYVQTFNND